MAVPTIPPAIAFLVLCVISVSPAQPADGTEGHRMASFHGSGMAPHAVTAAPRANLASGSVYYASPTGGGSGTSASSPFQVIDFWSVARPGDALLLLDGRYTGANSMITPPEGLSGVAGSPITVKALNDGKVEIDGQGIHATVRLVRNDWFVLEGFNVHSPGTSTSNSASVVWIAYSSNNIVRRVVGWDATDGNTNIFGAHHGDNNLFEDCAGFGVARKIFGSAQEGNNTTFRRCWGRWEGSHTKGPKQTITLGYNNYGMVVENSIFTWDSIQMQESYTLLDYDGTEIGPDLTNYEVYMPAGIVGHNGYDPPYENVANSRMLGSIIYLKHDQRFHNNFRWWHGAIVLGMPGIHVENTVAVIEPGVHDEIRSGYFADPGAIGQNSIRDLTLAGGSEPHIHSSWTASNVLPVPDCRSLAAGDGHVLDPSLSGTSGGAKIMKRYENGVLTDEDLWPWPMNDRILEATTRFSSKPVDVTREVFGLCGGTVPAEFENPGGDSAALDEAVQAARNWLASDPLARDQYESVLADYSGDIDSVIAEIRPNSFALAPTGEFIAETFTIPELRDKHPDHVFNYWIPEHYDPGRPVGLLVWLHGGGGYVPGAHAERRLRLLRPEIDNSDFIVVSPVAPFGVNLPEGLPDSHASRWNVPKAAEYLTDVITEFASRYNVDYSRVVLGGYSMGGIGAYHQAHRLNDRFAAVFISAGSWEIGAWRDMLNTPVYLHHGTHDSYWNSPTDYRWHKTDVMKSRVAAEVLQDLGYVYQFYEYDGDHSWNSDDAGVGWGAFLNGRQGWVTDKIRDPFPDHVIAITPRTSYAKGSNYGVTWTESPSPHQRWVSITQTAPGAIPFDWLHEEGGNQYDTYEQWQDYTAYRDVTSIEGAEVDAKLVGDNMFEVQTTNVTSFSLWLHPRMIDMSRPISVTVNGITGQFDCDPSLLDAMRSYQRGKDWGLIYHCEIPISVQSVGSEVNQSVQLVDGWNMVSLYVEPQDNRMADVLSPIMESVVMVKDRNGDVFNPSMGVSTVDTWKPGEAYQVYMSEGKSLTVAGTPISPNTRLSLLQGWNMTPYLSGTARPVDEAFASVSSDVLLVIKNNDGQIFSPSFGVNTIGSLQPGEGYLVYSSATADLVYGQ